jgi:hygromycin-B 7''-O-kinase
MESLMELDPDIDVAAFDALHDDPAAYRPILASIASMHVPGADLTLPGDGTVLVAVAGARVIKLYPPFLRDHFAFERAALDTFEGKLSVATPQLVDVGERGAWPYLVMTRLQGESLQRAWPAFSHRERSGLLDAIGGLMAQAHALPVAPLRHLAPRWDDFVAAQRRACHARQARTNLPPHLLAQVDAFVAQPEPAEEDVILTGEYTPMNLFVEGSRLVAMFDFGDGLIGARAYDWLGPMSFLAAGDRALHEAFLGGYGGTLDRERLMRLLLLHRYSNLAAQVFVEGWQRAPDFDALAAIIWPDR